MVAVSKLRLVGIIVNSVGLVVAILALVIFSIAVIQWLGWLYLALTMPGDIPWGGFRFAVPAPILFTVFLCSVIFRNRPRVFWTLLCAGIVVAAVWSAYDAGHSNWQISTLMLDGRFKDIYLSWPWLD